MYPAFATYNHNKEVYKDAKPTDVNEIDSHFEYADLSSDEMEIRDEVIYLFYESFESGV